MLRYISRSPQQTEDIAARLAPLLREGDVLCYRGPMGAGKTAFTRGLARGLGIGAGVSSPTFALVHEYRGAPLTLCHFDMYRVANEDDLYSAGFFDYLDKPGQVLAIEWSENIPFALYMPHITVGIRPLPGEGDQSREITVAGDSRFDAPGPILQGKGGDAP